MLAEVMDPQTTTTILLWGACWRLLLLGIRMKPHVPTMTQQRMPMPAGRSRVLPQSIAVIAGDPR